MALEITCLMPILNETKAVVDTSYVEICTALFKVSDCGIYNTATFKVDVKMNESTDPISIRIINFNTQGVLGSELDLTSDSIVEVGFDLPDADTAIIVEAKKDTDASTDPDLKSGYLYFQP